MHLWNIFWSIADNWGLTLYHQFNEASIIEFRCWVCGGVNNKVAEFCWMGLKNLKRTMQISVTILMGNPYKVGYSDARSFAKASLELATGKTVLSQTILVNCAKRVLFKVLQNLILEQSTHQRQTLLHPFHFCFYCHYRVHWSNSLKSKAPSRAMI